MTSRLDEQIRDLMQQVVDESPAPPLTPLGPAVHPKPVRRRKGWATAMVSAAAILLVVLGATWLFNSAGGDVVDDPVDTPVPPVTVVTTSERWNPILAETTAKAAPMAATCPVGADPDNPRPSDQLSPLLEWTGNLAAAFDRYGGRIVYVDVDAETWSFDVCTNTWHRAEPTGTPVPVDQLLDGGGQPSGILGQLVYDIDSDVVVSLGYDGVAVYDRNTNHWERRGTPITDFGVTKAGLYGAVYDPVSGLVVTSVYEGDDTWLLWAYDVDTNQWTELGALDLNRDTPCCSGIDLLGYSAQLDRLILTTYYEDRPATLLIDPRTGDIEVLASEDAPFVNLVWPGRVFGQANDTVYVYSDDGLCRFDADTLSWPCQEIPNHVPVEYRAAAAITDDPINQRIVLISGVSGEIWAVEPSTGQWVQLRQ